MKIAELISIDVRPGAAMESQVERVQMMPATGAAVVTTFATAIGLLFAERTMERTQ